LRRAIAAFVIAIGLHELLAMLVPSPARTAPSSREVVAHVTIARIVVRPSPSPTPRARIVPHVRVPANAEPKFVRPARTAATARPAIAPRERPARPRPPSVSHAKPIWDVPTGAQAAGGGSRSGTASGGAGGNGVSGSGAGGSEPCGYVEFSNPHGSRYDPQTRGFWVDIQMSVRFPDGRSDSVLLDYPWFYRSEAANPWSDRNLHDPNFPTTFQPPPPDKRANEPAIVQYVIAHTSAGGYTLLKDCPSPPPR
jgi:hypothetical protein